jgi:hypothetical protein
VDGVRSTLHLLDLSTLAANLSAIRQDCREEQRHADADDRTEPKEDDG